MSWRRPRPRTRGSSSGFEAQKRGVAKGRRKRRNPTFVLVDSSRLCVFALNPRSGSWQPAALGLVELTGEKLFQLREHGVGVVTGGEKLDLRALAGREHH